MGAVIVARFHGEMKGRGPRGPGRHPRTRCRSDKSQTKDTVPSGTSLLTTTGGTMGLHHDVGRRSHRRLIVCVLALALGATLGIAAPQAVAGPMGAHVRYGAAVSLKATYAQHSSKHIIVTGEAWPVEMVGQYVVISVQRKSPSGKWTAVTSARRQVLFLAPFTWQGTFNITDVFADHNVGTLIWQGQVTYQLVDVELDIYRADYELVSAMGTCTQTGFGSQWKSGENHDFSWAYNGTPVDDLGSLNWYFAESPLLGVARDSYDGVSWHTTTGLRIVTWDDGSVTTSEAQALAQGVIWPLDGSTGARPTLDGVNMIGSREESYSTGYTESLEWSLAPSETDFNDEVERGGAYSWSFTPKKKGTYRVRATIAKTADHPAAKSDWHTVKVK